MQNPKTYLFLLLLFFIVIIPNLGCNIFKVTSESNDLANADCEEGLVIVEQPTNSPVQLSIREAKCGVFYSNVKLVLKNISDKPVTGYEIPSIQDYENKKGVKSAQSSTGEDVILKPGETKEIVEAGGFTDGTSYGKPVGKLKRIVIKVSFVDFADGTRWIQD